jgi:hypothetical protein
MNSSHLSGNAIDIIGIKYKLLSNQVNEKKEKPYFETLIIFDVDINEKLFVFDTLDNNDKNKDKYAWKIGIDIEKNGRVQSSYASIINDICDNRLFGTKGSTLLNGNLYNETDKYKYKHYILSDPTLSVPQCVFILSPLMMYHFDYKNEKDEYYPLTLCYGSKFIKTLLHSISNRVEAIYDSNKNKYGGLYQHFMFCERFPDGTPKVLNPDYLQYSNTSFLFDDIFQTSIKVKNEKGKIYNKYVSITGDKTNNDIVANKKLYVAILTIKPIH